MTAPTKGPVTSQGLSTSDQPGQAWTRRLRLRIILLGLNAWAVTLGSALILGSAEPAVTLAVGLLALLPLAAGLRLQRPWARSTRAPLLLLLLYPAVLGLLLALSGPHTETTLDAVATALLLCLSLLAYLAATSQALQRARPLRQVTVHPLERERALPPAAPAPRLRLLVSGLLTAGAALIGVVAPSWGGRTSLQGAWGEAAPEGALLTAVVAAALATTVATLSLSSAQRRPQPDHRTSSQRRFRIASLLFLALLGAATYLVTG